jgi:hypothetical protein
MWPFDDGGYMFKISTGSGPDYVDLDEHLYLGDVTVCGGTGDDTLHSGVGHNRMYGGDGDDTFWTRRSSTIVWLRGNDGQDRIDDLNSSSSWPDSVLGGNDSDCFTVRGTFTSSSSCGGGDDYYANGSTVLASCEYNTGGQCW